MVAEATSARAGHQGEGYEDAVNGQQDAEGQEEPAAQHGALLPREGGVLGLYPGPWTLPWGGGGDFSSQARRMTPSRVFNC